MQQTRNSLLSPVELAELAETIAETLAERIAQRRLVDRYQLAELLGVSVPTIDRRLTDPAFPRVRIGRRVLFEPDRVIEYFRDQNWTACDKSNNIDDVRD